MADVAGSFGAAFQGALSGFKGGLDIANQQQLQTLRDRDQKMQEFKTFGDISKEYANDPDMGKILISDLGKRLGLTEDEIKSKHQFLSALNEERLRAVTSLAYQAGVDPNSMPLKDIMKMPNLDLAKYLQDQGTKQSGQRVAGIEAGTPGASPTPGGAVAGAGGTPATTAPVSAPGAMSPALPVQQGATPGAATGLNAANQDMQLNPQEQALYQRHLSNLGGSGKVQNPDGSISTLRQMTVDIDGKTRVIPTVWNGKILSPQDAIKRAEAEGIDKFPAYNSPEEAQTRYDKLHSYMEGDTANYIKANSRGITPQQIAMLESGGNAAARNPRSTATGQYQITDQTRDDFANRYGIDRGNDDAIMRLKTAEDHKIFTQQHGRPATAAEGAMQWRFGGTGGAKIAAADPNTPIERLVTPDVMQANPDLAGKTAGQVKTEIEGKLGGTQQAAAPAGLTPTQPPAPATTTSAGAIKVPAPDGTDISLPANAMTRSAIVARDTVNDIQTRIDRLNKALADPNSKVQDRSGLLARVDKLQAERKSLEGNAVVTLPPGSSAKFGSNKVGDIVSYNLITGKIEFPMQGQEKETELTPTERIEAGVDPGKVVTRTASGAIKVAEVGKDKEQLLGKAEMDAEAARGVPIDRTEVYSKNLTTGAVRPVSTLTSERTRSRLLAEHDIKTLTDLRAARTTANEQLGHSAVIKALGDITPTGALGNIQLNLSKLAEAAGWNPTRIKGLYDPAQGEVLRSELGKSVITQLAGPEGLKGASSDKELNFASNNAGSLLTTPKGIQWMQDLKEYKAKNVHKIADLADSWDGGSGDLSKQATSGPYKGMTFHQARGQIESEGAIPKEFVDRLHQAVGDAPDPKKISWWNRPISELNPLEVKRMSVEGIDKLNEDQLMQLRSRAVELGLNKGQ